jgi:hypothetical protein
MLSPHGSGEMPGKARGFARCDPVDQPFRNDRAAGDDFLAGAPDYQFGCLIFVGWGIDIFSHGNLIIVPNLRRNLGAGQAYTSSERIVVRVVVYAF